mmetsp:Transcript_46282/g.110002  ORF Transcript_46282/g.110002 Transcript_46282/m.110002 type:complete len:245 (+) Transcript_46282:251-985(+)
MLFCPVQAVKQPCSFESPPFPQEPEHVQEEVQEVQVQTPCRKGIHVDGVLDLPLPPSELRGGGSENHLSVIDNDHPEEGGAHPSDDLIKDQGAWEQGVDQDEHDHAHEKHHDVGATPCEVSLCPDGVDGQSDHQHEGQREDQQHRLGGVLGADEADQHTKADRESHQVQIVPGRRLHHPEVAPQQSGASAAELAGHAEVEDHLRQHDEANHVEDPLVPVEEPQGSLGVEDKGRRDAEGDQQHGA